MLESWSTILMSLSDDGIKRENVISCFDNWDRGLTGAAYYCNNFAHGEQLVHKWGELKGLS